MFRNPNQGSGRGCGSILLLAAVHFLAVLAVATASAQEAERVKRVEVIGSVDSSNLDKANAVRFHAMRLAIQQAGGAQVRSHDAVRFGELVANFTYVRAQALVESIRETSPPSEADGVYRQAFEVLVRIPELNRELVSEKIDVQLLYDLVQKPRILVAVVDEWSRDQVSPFEKDPDQLSRQLIISGFQSRHRDFVFKEPGLLGQGENGDVAVTEEARRNQFDIVILGSTQSRMIAGPVQAAPVQDRGMTANGVPDPLAKLARISQSKPPPKAQFDVAVSWRVVNAATSETLFVLSGNRDPQDTDPVEVVASKRLAKSQLVERKTGELFSTLLQIWNQRVFSENYEVLVRTSAEQTTEWVMERLRNSGFDASSIMIRESSPGSFSFSATASLRAEELRDNLNRAFDPALRVVASSRGKFTLEPAKASSLRTVDLWVSVARLTESEEISRALQKIPGVNRHERLSHVGGRAQFRLDTTLTDGALGIALEELLGKRFRVTGLGSGSLEAEMVSDTPPLPTR